MAGLERDEAEGAPLLSDPVYQVLGNERRRHVLQVLAAEDDPIDIGTLAERVAGLENDRPVAEVTYDQRKSVYTGLHQNHLPMMEQVGLVRSEGGWDRIELTDRGAEIQRRIAGRDRRSAARDRLSVALAALVVGLFLGVGVVPPSMLSLVDPLYGLLVGLSLLAVGYVLMK
ncbi:DUF7344 domain-containing protein [Haloplanus halophilus]|uniref:DUF7344 domain-containing protein n=1 Tax=Haloplanus halophilus TaxID=2949993 RepID=UPI00203AE062|nr:hypothetical protein [Haloplanus sp. GDY1]